MINIMGIPLFNITKDNQHHYINSLPIHPHPPLTSPKYPQTLPKTASTPSNPILSSCLILTISPTRIPNSPNTSPIPSLFLKSSPI